MKKTKFERYEGFWWSEDKPMLPMPEMQWNREAARKMFMKDLAKVEDGVAHNRKCKGSSDCRLCGEVNGSSTYELTGKKYKWYWPSGLFHYIEEHNIKPSKDFRAFIKREAAKLR